MKSEMFPVPILSQTTPFDRLWHWISERHRIWQNRQYDRPKPWTQDEVLRAYRFCNVYRELDTVTQWIAKNWREPHQHDPDLWFAMVVARLVNWPDTLAEIGYPVPYDRTRFLDAMHGRKAAGEKVFSGAYIVSTNGNSMDKAEYLADYVFRPLWEKRSLVRPVPADTLSTFHERLMRFDGMGSFIAAQVVADMKYANPLDLADDWFYWAASGPGSRRGLNRVLGRDKNAPWREADWRAELGKLLAKVTPLVKAAKMPTLHAQDLQNCLCEFDKYERVLHNEGTPRSRYPGA